MDPLNTDKMSILEFLDRHNKIHLEAFRHYCLTGQFPSGVIPDHVRFPVGWEMAFISILADAYLESQIGESPRVILPTNISMRLN